jgi:hypothetical protein
MLMYSKSFALAANGQLQAPTMQEVATAATAFKRLSQSQTTTHPHNYANKTRLGPTCKPASCHCTVQLLPTVVTTCQEVLC